MATTVNIDLAPWYPVVIAVASACVGAFLPPDTRKDATESSVDPTAARYTAPI